VLERFDAEGRLAGRSVEKLDGEVEIAGPVERTIAGRRFSLRGLNACPTEKVVYNRMQSWSCADAARDYAEALYNRPASAILCKTLVLEPATGETSPASCFVLVGGKGEPFKTVNDDDSMVFLGLAAIGRTDDGRSRRGPRGIAIAFTINGVSLSRRTASKGREALVLIAEYGGRSFDKLMAERANTIPPDSSFAAQSLRK